jgi:transposase
MKQFLVVGVDVSKTTLDFCFKPSGSRLTQPNNLTGFRLWMKELKGLVNDVTIVMIVMEHTGRYSRRFESFLKKKGIDYCKVPALEIKRSIGMTRGKNDQVDAQRIAEYGWLRRENLQADKPCEAGVQRLRELLSVRAKFVSHRSGYICRLKEMRSAEDFDKKDPVIVMQQKLIATLSANIKAIEKQIQELINSLPDIQQTAQLLKSIKGIGHIIAAYMIACTNNFRRFSNARKFNCYAGLAPFKRESGTSIRGRAHVSHLANKEAKTLLNLAATCAIRFDKELKTYYQKRVSEGMKKMSCINIIRSKIVARMFAVVKRQTPYVNLRVAA